MQPIHIIPDTHIPFHDKAAWALNLKVIRERQPKTLIIMGDFADFYSINGHGVDPKHRDLRLKDEVGAVNTCLDQLDAAVPNAARYFIQGNHEWRLDRYIQDRAAKLHGMLTTEKSFRLRKRGWHYTPYHQHIKIGSVFYTHDTGKAGANAHRQAERAFSDNAVIGHTHRMALEISGNARGKPHVCGMFGWLGDINAAEYMHLINARRDWTLGFGTGWMKKDGTTFFSQHPIVNGEACVDGHLFK